MPCRLTVLSYWLSERSGRQGIRACPTQHRAWGSLGPPGAAWGRLSLQAGTTYLNVSVYLFYSLLCSAVLIFSKQISGFRKSPALCQSGLERAGSANSSTASRTVAARGPGPVREQPCDRDEEEPGRNTVLCGDLVTAPCPMPNARDASCAQPKLRSIILSSKIPVADSSHNSCQETGSSHKFRGRL